MPLSRSDMLTVVTLGYIHTIVTLECVPTVVTLGYIHTIVSICGILIPTIVFIFGILIPTIVLFLEFNKCTIAINKNKTPYKSFKQTQILSTHTRWHAGHQGLHAPRM
jgi:hypothetical protein